MPVTQKQLEEANEVLRIDLLNLNEKEIYDAIQKKLFATADDADAKKIYEAGLIIDDYIQSGEWAKAKAAQTTVQPKPEAFSTEPLTPPDHKEEAVKTTLDKIMKKLGEGYTKNEDQGSGIINDKNGQPLLSVQSDRITLMSNLHQPLQNDAAKINTLIESAQAAFGDKAILTYTGNDPKQKEFLEAQADNHKPPCLFFAGSKEQLAEYIKYQRQHPDTSTAGPVATPTATAAPVATEAGMPAATTTTPAPREPVLPLAQIFTQAPSLTQAAAVQDSTIPATKAPSATPPVDETVIEQLREHQLAEALQILQGDDLDKKTQYLNELINSGKANEIFSVATDKHPTDPQVTSISLKHPKELPEGKAKDLIVGMQNTINQITELNESRREKKTDVEQNVSISIALSGGQAEILNQKLSPNISALRH